MKIRSKEDFFELLLLAMSLKGAIVETFTFPDDFILFTFNSKYDDLFYFFEQEQDFIFEKELMEYGKKGLIEIRNHNDGTLTISLQNTYFINKLLNHFDDNILNKMILLLEEINESKKLQDTDLYSETQAIFKKENPNRIYEINNDMLIVTDGNVLQKAYLATGCYLVSQASFVCLHRIYEGKIEEVTVLYRFAYERYLYNVLRKIVLLIRKNQNYEMAIKDSSLDVSKQFEEFHNVKGYRYKDF